MLVLYGDVGREHAAYDWVLKPAVHVDEVEVVVMLMQGVATFEGVAHIAITEVGRVAPSSPGIIVQPLNVAAVGFPFHKRFVHISAFQCFI